MLQRGHEEALADLVAAEPGAVRPLMGRLWDPDAQIRARAAAVMGRAAADHPDLGLEMTRRLMWARGFVDQSRKEERDAWERLDAIAQRENGVGE